MCFRISLSPAIAAEAHAQAHPLKGSNPTLSARSSQDPFDPALPR